MAKALVFEGCPACERRSGYGQIALPDTRYMRDTLVGGAIGMSSAVAIDIILPKIFPRVGPTMAAITSGGLAAVAAAMLRVRNPQLALGIGIGGVSIALYKLMSSWLRKTLGFSGFGDIMYEESGLSEVEVEEAPEYGVLVAEPEYGQEEVIIE